MLSMKNCVAQKIFEAQSRFYHTIFHVISREITWISWISPALYLWIICFNWIFIDIFHKFFWFGCQNWSFHRYRSHWGRFQPRPQTSSFLKKYKRTIFSHLNYACTSAENRSWLYPSIHLHPKKVWYGYRAWCHTYTLHLTFAGFKLDTNIRNMDFYRFIRSIWVWHPTRFFRVWMYAF